MKKLILSLYSLTLLFFLGVLSASTIDEATVHSEKIVLGSGCFWGAEKGYESLPGVIDAVSGYADGEGVRATYREITKLKNKFNNNNHAEVVEVTYNKNVISTEDDRAQLDPPARPVQLPYSTSSSGPASKARQWHHQHIGSPDTGRPPCRFYGKPTASYPLS